MQFPPGVHFTQLQYSFLSVQKSYTFQYFYFFFYKKLGLCPIVLHCVYASVYSTRIWFCEFMCPYIHNLLQ